LGFSPAHSTAPLTLLGRSGAQRYAGWSFEEKTMVEAKLAPNMPEWMIKHANLYLASGGKEGQMYKANVPDRGEITAPALLLTTTGRKSGDKFIFPLFYGTDGDSYFVVASKGGAPNIPDGIAISSQTRMSRCRSGRRS
jgi:F420H(2)-dependent quinone reductase